MSSVPIIETSRSPSQPQPPPVTSSSPRNRIGTNQSDVNSKRKRTGMITSFFGKKTREFGEEASSNPPQTPSRVASVNANSERENEDGVHSIPTTQPDLVRLTEFDIVSLSSDPGLRKKLSDYHPSDREIIQREYIRRGPCQPIMSEFPQTLIRKYSRKFRSEWYIKFKPWLEYSEQKDAAYCFVCYLFKKDNMPGSDNFISSGFRNWSRSEAFDTHVGNHMSAHNNAMRDLDSFKKQKYSIVSNFDNHSAATKSAYLTRMEASIKTARFLLQQGMSFRGHRENETSLNRGNFIELLKLLAQHDGILLVETMKHLTHSKVYLLLKLVLILPVATATVERAFSAMTFVKNKVRNSMGDEFLNDSLVTFVERDLFMSLTEGEIVKQFMNMRSRRIT